MGTERDFVVVMERTARHSDGHTETSESQLTGSSFTGSGNDCHRSSNRPRGPPQRQGRRNRPASPAPPVQPAPSDLSRFRGLLGSLLNRSVRASRCLPGWRIGQPTWGVTPVAVRLGNPEGLGARVPSIINVQCHSSRQELDWSAHDDICPQKGTSRSMLYS